MDCGPARASGENSGAARAGNDGPETTGTAERKEDAMRAGAAASGKFGRRSGADATAQTGAAEGGARLKPGGKEGHTGETTVGGGNAGGVDRGCAALGAAGWGIVSGAANCAEGRAHAVKSDAVRMVEWPGDVRGPPGAEPAMGRSTECR